MSSEYRMELRRHVQDVQSRFGNYVRTPFETGILDDSSLSDKAAYFLTKLWRDNADMNYRISQQTTPAMGYAGNEHMMLRRSGHGYQVIDPYTGRAKGFIVPHADSLDISGPSEITDKIGGRERISGIIKLIEDGDMFRNLDGHHGHEHGKAA